MKTTMNTLSATVALLGITLASCLETEFEATKESDLDALIAKTVREGLAVKELVLSDGVFQDMNVYRDGDNESIVFEYVYSPDHYMGDLPESPPEVARRKHFVVKKSANSSSRKVLEEGVYVRYLVKNANGTAVADLKITSQDLELWDSGLTSSAEAEKRIEVESTIAKSVREALALKPTILSDEQFQDTSVYRDNENDGVVYEFVYSPDHFLGDLPESPEQIAQRKQFLTQNIDDPSREVIENDVYVRFLYKNSKGKIVADLTITKSDLP